MKHLGQLNFHFFIYAVGDKLKGGLYHKKRLKRESWLDWNTLSVVVEVINQCLRIGWIWIVEAGGAGG